MAEILLSSPVNLVSDLVIRLLSRTVAGHPTNRSTNQSTSSGSNRPTNRSDGGPKLATSQTARNRTSIGSSSSRRIIGCRYVLDEPEAALSPSRQLAMIVRLHQLVQSRSQLIIATHSPILMAYPHAWIYQITAQGIERVSYQKTEHYVVARRFLNDTQ